MASPAKSNLSPWLSHDSSQRKNAEYSHALTSPHPGALTPLELLSAGLAPFPIVGGSSQIAADLEMYNNDPSTRTPLNYGLTATNLLPGAPMVLGALRGVRRLPPLWHGTANNPQDILKEGFTQGSSAELNIPGTSASEDPLVAFGFANVNRNRDDPTKRILKVKPQFGPEEVANLPPSAYFAGDVPEAPAYRKPNLFFQEAETFSPREDFSSLRKQLGLDPNSTTVFGREVPRPQAAYSAEPITPKEQSAISAAAQNYNKAEGALTVLTGYGLVLYREAPKSGKLIPLSQQDKIKNVADAFKAVKGNPGKYTGLVDSLMSQTTAIPELPQTVKGLAEEAYNTKMYMSRLRTDVESDARILKSIQTAGRAATVDPSRYDIILKRLQSNGKALDKAYRDYYRTRDKFMTEFENFAYKTKPAVDAPTKPEDLIP